MNYLSQCLAALFASSVLVACGGGDFDSAAFAAVLPAPTDACDATTEPVRLEGCLVDADGRAVAGAVLASSNDGRVLTSTLSDTDGVFRLQVPARQLVRLTAASPGAEPLTLLTGSGAPPLAGCLRVASQPNVHSAPLVRG